MASPNIKCEVAFAVGPLVTPTAPQWIDVSAYVEGFSTRRGRSNEFDTIQAGTVTLTLNNKARLFDPTNTASTYYPNVVPGKQIRIRATWNAVDYAVFRGFVQSWQYQENGLYGSIQVSITDVVGAYFSRLQLGNETILETTWTGISYPTSPNLVPNMGTQPGNRKLAFTLPTLATGEAAIIYAEGTDGGGSPVNEFITLIYPTLIAQSVNNYQVLTKIQEYAYSGAAVIGKSYTVSLDPTFPSEFSGDAFQSLLDTAQWTSSSVLSGVSLVQAQTPTSNLLAALNAVVDAEDGVFFVAADGTVTFRSRHYRITQATTTALVNVAGTGGGLPEAVFEKIIFDNGDRYIYNEIKMQAAGGDVQVARDVTSKAAYFLRTYSKSGLLITSDAEAQAAAEWRLARYKDPAVRVTQVVLRGDLSTTAAWATIFGLEINTRVRVVWTPPDGGTAYTQDSLIEGINVTGQRGSWTVTVSLSPRAITTPYLILDDATYGRLDLNALAY